MKRIIYISCIVLFCGVISSCGTTQGLRKDSMEVAGYTLKDKAELMQQKILNTKHKTVIVIP
ncbi:hypothetical protein [Altibacter sp.]|uniref:hypothetical protein n=1 Tax=Altibacter sp. TaxID=2024823 RepID=UPI000C8E8FAD|nr:hypothetical protein [Altibacter sp.]MAP54107.1 hypothetical protein [Altibacter sp.]